MSVYENKISTIILLCMLCIVSQSVIAMKDVTQAPMYKEIMKALEAEPFVQKDVENWAASLAEGYTSASKKDFINRVLRAIPEKYRKRFIAMVMKNLSTDQQKELIDSLSDEKIPLEPQSKNLQNYLFKEKDIEKVSEIKGINLNRIKYVVKTDQKIKSKKPVFLVSVHGTFATPEEFGEKIYKEDITWFTWLFGGNKQITESRLGVASFKYAKELANKYGNDVDWWIFQWSGSSDQLARDEAAKELADVLINYITRYEIKTIQDVPLFFSIAHSHGCNVMNMAARHFFNATQKQLGSGINFTVGIHIASPEPVEGHPDLDKKNPFNFEKLFHFYSTHDATQAIGSKVCGLGFSRKLPCLEIKNDAGEWTNRIWNIRLLDNGQELNHINIKWVAMEHANNLIQQVTKQYENVFDLDANVNTPNQKDPLVVIRLLGEKEKETCVVGDYSSVKKYSDTQKDIFKKQYGYGIEEKFGYGSGVIGELCELWKNAGWRVIEQKK